MEHEAKVSAQGRLLRWLGARVWNASMVVTCLVAIGTLASLFARSHWLFDLAANLRVQQVIALATVGAIAIMFRRPRWLAGIVVMLAIHLPWFTSAWTGRERLGEVPELTVMLANVLTSNQQYDSVVEQIFACDPDVVAILELGTAMQGRLQREDVMSAYSHRIDIPQDFGNFGIGLYSKFPLRDVAFFTLNLDDVPSIDATFSKGGRDYRIVATHPLPPIGSRGFRLRNTHLRQLAARIDPSRNADRVASTIVVGDLNLTPWSPLFSDLESHASLRRAGRGYGLTPTWYARPFFPFGLKLDHVLISGDLHCTDYKVGPFIGSDHRAVIVGLR